MFIRLIIYFGQLFGANHSCLLMRSAPIWNTHKWFFEHTPLHLQVPRKKASCACATWQTHLRLHFLVISQNLNCVFLDLRGHRFTAAWDVTRYWKPFGKCRVSSYSPCESCTRSHSGDQQSSELLLTGASSSDPRCVTLCELPPRLNDCSLQTWNKQARFPQTDVYSCFNLTAYLFLSRSRFLCVCQGHFLCRWKMAR